MLDHEHVLKTNLLSLCVQQPLRLNLSHFDDHLVEKSKLISIIIIIISMNDIYFNYYDLQSYPKTLCWP